MHSTYMTNFGKFDHIASDKKLVSGIQVKYFKLIVHIAKMLLQLQFRRSGSFKHSGTEGAALRKQENKYLDVSMC